MTRDSQRQRVYDAETGLRMVLNHQHEVPVIEWHGSRLTLPAERKFGDLAGAQAYVERVLALNWVRARWPHAHTPITVRERQGAARTHYEARNAVIAVPPHRGGISWAMRETVLLHEIAHHLTRWDTPAHDPVFASTFHELVEGVMGPEAGFLLYTLMLQNEVQLG